VSAQRLLSAWGVAREPRLILRFKDLIASGPRAPRAGAPHTLVTTEMFLVTFDLKTLRALPELELAVDDAGK
jgi:segregation and condensation protein B